MEAGKLERDFTRELAVYERHRAALERDHYGKVVLIHGDELVGVYEDPMDAGSEAHRRFPLDQVLITDIGDPVHFMPLAVLPGADEDAEST